MNTLLIFFALPIAVIIISIALQKIFKCPFLVAGIIFAIFLVVTFAIGNLTFLIATIAYTILSFITAVITKIICRILRELEERNCNCHRRCRYGCQNNDNNETQLLSISGNCTNNDNGNVLTISSNGCNNCNTSTNGIAVSANVFPNNNGNTGSFKGCYRRR